MVRELTMAYRDQSSVKLQWLAPSHDGGRADIRYRVECIGCDGHVAYTPRQSNLHGTASVLVTLTVSGNCNNNSNNNSNNNNHSTMFIMLSSMA